MEVLRKDNTRTVLIADKGVALVVLDQEDYVKKAEELLSQTTYNKINNDPTTKHMNRLINLLKTIKSEGGINEALYRKIISNRGRGAKILWPPQNSVKKRHL